MKELCLVTLINENDYYLEIYKFELLENFIIRVEYVDSLIIELDLTTLVEKNKNLLEIINDVDLYKKGHLDKIKRNIYWNESIYLSSREIRIKGKSIDDENLFNIFDL